MSETPGKLKQTGSLSRGVVLGTWGGVIGVGVGCSAWLMAMAGMGGDWMAVLVTALFVVASVYIIGRLCLQNMLYRFVFMAVLMVLVSSHCLAIFWWRYELWRRGAEVTQEVLLREKTALAFTLAGMIGFVLIQFLLFNLIISRRNRQGKPLKK